MSWPPLRPSRRFLDAAVSFYRRARGNPEHKRLAAWGYNTKHFARLLFWVFEHLCPGIGRTLHYQDVAQFIPDSREHIPEALARLSLAELATTVDVAPTEIPMWACLVGAGQGPRLVSMLLAVGDIAPVVRWHRDRVTLDCDGDQWPFTVPDTLEEWVALYESEGQRVDPPTPAQRAGSG